MSAFLERLRKALASDYELLDEIAGGGMGLVYRARDRGLDRLVAIKVVRPDLATAALTGRFLREARILASFSHPNIVPVHRAGEADGLAYYVMDYLEGETLARRLQRGPLPPAEVERCAAGLLGALEAVHARGVVHRDVKPSNLFLVGDRAVLSDFGISKATRPEASQLTEPGHIVGTPGYMAPEQFAGGEVTPRTDVCAAAMVLYEAFTGRHWSFDSDTAAADFGGVPERYRPALRRALAWAPNERFADAGAFRRAFAGRLPRPGRLRAVVALVLVLAGWLILRGVPMSLGGTPTLEVDIGPITTAGGTPPTLGAELASEIVTALRAAADIEVRPAEHRWLRRPDLAVSGIAETRGDTVVLQLHATSTHRGGQAFDARAAGTRMTVADSAASDLLTQIWRQAGLLPGGDLPIGALPQSAAGMQAWIGAEALYAHAQWGAAAHAYDAALAIDSTCALCDLRMMLISRWLRLNPDPARTRRVLADSARFPPHYIALVRAGVDTTDRWAALRAAVDGAPRFALAHFLYGDELFHRGPLAGRERDQAVAEFETALRLGPNFAPGWEHLAWAAITEGDSAVADSALRAYERDAAADDIESQVIRALLTVGFAWRFTPPAAAAAVTGQVLQTPGLASVADFQSGPRYLLSFDAPAGVVWLGERFAEWPTRPDLRVPGLVGQIVGLVALGRPDSARVLLGRLRGESSEPAFALDAAEFEAALVLFDSLDTPGPLARLDTILAPLTREGPAFGRARAAWMLTLIARRAGADGRGWRALVAGPGTAPLARLLDADSLARAGRTGDALRTSEPLLRLDSAGRAGDPFFRSALHLMRAGWFQRDGRPADAVRSLLWHGNTDFVGHSSAIIQAGDVDWAFGTLGRWYRARLAQSGGRTACRAWRGVARLWADGEPRYAERAAAARERLQSLHCQAGP